MLQEKLRSHKLKKKLESKKEDRIRNQIKARKREKTNLDESHLKSGKIEKTKIIQKKKFETEIQKARKVAVEIQDNANPSTYIATSQEYLTILNRTKSFIRFDNQKLKNGCKAIAAFAEAKKERVITLELVMQNQIVCHDSPVLLRLADPETDVNCIIITGKKQVVENQAINDLNISIMSLQEFITQSKQDNKFRRNMTAKLTRIFCDFKIFARSKLIKGLLAKNQPVFPIDLKKVPFSIKEQLPNYHAYLKYLLGASFAVARSGKQHRVRLRVREAEKLAVNVEAVTHQMVARLIQKNKKKGNKLVQARLKTDSSIPIDIYE